MRASQGSRSCKLIPSFSELHGCTSLEQFVQAMCVYHCLQTTYWVSATKAKHWKQLCKFKYPTQRAVPKPEASGPISEKLRIRSSTFVGGYSKYQQITV